MEWNLKSITKENWKFHKNLEIKWCTLKQPMGQNHKRIRKYHEKSENKNTVCQNLWNTVKAMLGRKFITVITYIEKEERSQMII